VTEFKSLKEALTFAAEKEQASVDFYSQLAQRMEEPTTRALMEDLAAEEADHRSRVELEILKLGQVVEPDAIQARPHVTGIEALEDVPTDFSPLEGLRLAIRKEEAAFRLYVGLLAETQDPEIHEALLALAQEEVRHKVRFEKVYEAVQARERQG
jgi:rubrerythrin